MLKYRLGPRYHHPAMIDDAHQAIRTRAQSREGIRDRPACASASWASRRAGHLASTAATHFDAETRPDFAILIYAVISFDDYAHTGSRKNLLGDNPDPKLVESLSNYKQVTPQTPPTFLMHTDEDKVVPPENSVLFYMALRKAKVPAELHIFEKGTARCRARAARPDSQHVAQSAHQLVQVARLLPSYWRRTSAASYSGKTTAAATSVVGTRPPRSAGSACAVAQHLGHRALDRGLPPRPAPGGRASCPRRGSSPAD